MLLFVLFFPTDRGCNRRGDGRAMHTGDSRVRTMTAQRERGGNEGPHRVRHGDKRRRRGRKEARTHRLALGPCAIQHRTRHLVAPALDTSHNFKILRGSLFRRSRDPHNARACNKCHFRTFRFFAGAAAARFKKVHVQAGTATTMVRNSLYTGVRKKHIDQRKTSRLGAARCASRSRLKRKTLATKCNHSGFQSLRFAALT